MAKLYVTEFSQVLNLGETVAIAKTPPIVDQTPVAIGSSAAASAAFNKATKLIRLETDAVCSISIGTNAVATANNARMAANSVEYFAVNPGDVVSVITNS